jgi:hypothetical protein
VQPQQPQFKKIEGLLDALQVEHRTAWPSEPHHPPATPYWKHWSPLAPWAPPLTQKTHNLAVVTTVANA